MQPRCTPCVSARACWKVEARRHYDPGADRREMGLSLPLTAGHALFPVPGCFWTPRRSDLPNAGRTNLQIDEIVSRQAIRDSPMSLARKTLPGLSDARQPPPVCTSHVPGHPPRSPRSLLQASDSVVEYRHEDPRSSECSSPSVQNPRVQNQQNTA